jgi:DNA-binding transcriptional regulator YdaS (Cro superfamily)
MQLRAYLNLAKLSYSEMAKRIGTNAVSVVSRHARGIWHPTPEFVERYERATNGAVTAEDWQKLALDPSLANVDDQERAA